MIMEARKSLNLYFWSESKDLRRRRSQWFKVQSKSKDNTRPLSQLEESQAEKVISLTLLFGSIRAFSGLDEACPHWEGNLLYSVYKFKC